MLGTGEHRLRQRPFALSTGCPLQVGSGGRRVSGLRATAAERATAAAVMTLATSLPRIVVYKRVRYRLRVWNMSNVGGW